MATVTDAEALADVLTCQIDDNVRNGLAEGYPPCCVDWFAYVWWPVCVLFWRLLPSRDWDAFNTEIRPRLAGHGQEVGYVQCPHCRRAASSPRPR